MWEVVNMDPKTSFYGFNIAYLLSPIEFFDKNKVLVEVSWALS